jgi:protein gp37
MLGPVNLLDINGALISWREINNTDCVNKGYIDWVICGGETGYGSREMKSIWAFDLYQQCRDASVPFFFKRPGDAFKGEEINLPKVRQWPSVK